MPDTCASTPGTFWTVAEITCRMDGAAEPLQKAVKGGVETADDQRGTPYKARPQCSLSPPPDSSRGANWGAGIASATAEVECALTSGLKSR